MEKFSAAGSVFTFNRSTTTVVQGRTYTLSFSVTINRNGSPIPVSGAIFFTSNNVQGFTSAGSYNPDPLLYTYAEGRYLSGTTVLIVLSFNGVTSAAVYAPAGRSFFMGRTVHQADSNEWGYFSRTEIRP